MAIAARQGLALLALLAHLVLATDARAAPPVTATSPARLLHNELTDQAPFATTLDGMWGFTLTLSWLASARSLAGPTAQGLGAVVVARVLNGTTWTVMLGLELAALKELGGGWGWLERARYSTDQLFGIAVPAGCASPGTPAGCGLGLGGFDELRGKLRGRPWWGTISGGWIQGRAATDARRTVIESTWVLSPLAIQGELAGALGPLGARVALGPGVYFGMHAAHVHPETTTAELKVPWTEIYPLDIGVGVGLRGDAALTIGRALSLEGSAVVAPLAGVSATRLDPEVAPLRAASPRSALFWRSASAGASVELPGTSGSRVGLRYWVGELSSRPLLAAGHHAISLRWEIPLRP